MVATGVAVVPAGHVVRTDGTASAARTGADGLLRTVERTVVDAGAVRVETEQDSIDNAGDAAAAAFQPTQRIGVNVSSVETVTDSEDLQTPVGGGIRLTVKWPEGDGTEATAQALHCGDRIRAVVRLTQPSVYHDGGVWSYTDYLLGQGITSTGTLNLDRVDVVGKNASD